MSKTKIASGSDTDSGAHDGPTPDELFQECIDELRRIASYHMRGQRRGHTLQTTALINEAYEKLSRKKHWTSRQHFLAVATKAMRQILIDHERGRNRDKRAGKKNRIPIEFVDRVTVSFQDVPVKVMDFETGLRKLEASSERGKLAAEIVVLKIYSGLTLEEISVLKGIPLRTVERLWAYARAWFLDWLKDWFDE